MIPKHCSHKNPYIINYASDDIISKFEAFTKNKVDTIYLIEIIRTEWLQIIDEYCNEGDTPYSSSLGI